MILTYCCCTVFFSSSSPKRNFPTFFIFLFPRKWIFCFVVLKAFVCFKFLRNVQTIRWSECWKEIKKIYVLQNKSFNLQIITYILRLCNQNFKLSCVYLKLKVYILTLFFHFEQYAVQVQIPRLQEWTIIIYNKNIQLKYISL
jgi:hypothetical protein